MRANYLFTSESVSEGHPDKVSDQISDGIVDLFLSKDPESRVACETVTSTQKVVLAGEIRGKGIMDESGNWAPGVEREHITCASSGAGQRAQLHKGCAGRCALARARGQGGHQLFELAALAFPADPAPFTDAVAAPAVQQQEARRGRVVAALAVAGVELGHAGGGPCQQGVPGRCGLWSW